MTVSIQSDRRPLISLVVSVYNVEEYLPAFLDSLDALKLESGIAEVIFVIDGSPDQSESMIRQWIGARPIPAAVHVKENGGLSSARNAGMALATGEWISFPDPDDIISVDYLSRLAEFMRSDQATRVSMIAARLMQFISDVDELTTPHPLDFRFDEPVRIAPLLECPKYFHLHSASGFYRLDVIKDAGINFDVRIQPVFEDGAFTASYLLLFADPVMAYVSDAEYFYRKRENQSSLTGEAWGKPGKYTDVLEFGHLKVLRSAGSEAPRWLQYMMLYDLQWYPKADERGTSETSGIAQALLDRFHELLIEILQYIDDESVWTYNATGVPVRMRLALLSLKNGKVPPQPVHVVKLDQAQRLMLIQYFTADSDSAEIVRYSGKVVAPVYTKTTALNYFARPWLYQRELWVTAVRDVSVEIAGHLCRVSVGPQYAPGYETNVVNIWRRFARSEPPGDFPPELHTEPPTTTSTAQRTERSPRGSRSAVAKKPTVKRRLLRSVNSVLGRFGIQVKHVRTVSRHPVISEPAVEPPGDKPTSESPAQVIKRASGARARARYANAWVLIDRDTMAQDNAEALYRHLREHRPEINSWFVLSSTSSDWKRLASDGFRLIDHGSTEHVVLMKNADFLLSSQIDEYIVKPYDPKLYRKGHWKFVFLQHGVTHNDLSRWINSKPIDLMITATEQETEMIVGDGSPFSWSRKEVKLTGFPRHDTLLRKASDLPTGSVRTILVMPTWRDHLMVRARGGHHRELRDDFTSTQYAREWGGLLRAQDLRDIASRRRLAIKFAPHPNLQAHSAVFDLPHDVELIRYSDVDIQQVLAEAAVLVTDYSSLAFEAAFLETPVVYFQFDRHEFFSGGHAFRRGTFSYEDDGFGPVVSTRSAALASIDTILDDTSEERQLYDRRLAGAFPARDGQASARVVQAIIDSEKPVTV